MKKDKDKCKKGKESTIGKIIYGFLLFAPLLAILSTCLYAIFNDNARDSFEGSLTYKETINVTEINQIISGRNYYSLQYVGRTNTNTTYNITNLVISNENDQVTFNSTDYPYTYYAIYRDGGIFRVNGQETQYVDSQPTLNSLWQVNTDSINIYIKIDVLIFNSPRFSSPVLPSWMTVLNYDSYYVNTKLNDVFYYAVESVEKSSLFNWAENSIIYTGMSEFTTSLSITNTFIPLLLTYWLIISLVYFIYDIVLIIFNVLHRKIHELQDSI